VPRGPNGWDGGLWVLGNGRKGDIRHHSMNGGFELLIHKGMVGLGNAPSRTPFNVYIGIYDAKNRPEVEGINVRGRHTWREGTTRSSRGASQRSGG